jgi:hypothetical protein
MSQAYSNPERASDPHALPDVEVFHVSTKESADFWADANGDPAEPGWYWWACFPGCLPDGDPNGPFATEAAALADAQSECGEEC